MTKRALLTEARDHIAWIRENVRAHRSLFTAGEYTQLMARFDQLLDTIEAALDDESSVPTTKP